MAQTHYIEVDEEIISAVGRLRRTAEAENVFVFPKRALILQSIVNLKLLEREARKLGKKIIVVTQDSSGKSLAEKAGLLTQEYREDHARGPAPTANFTVEHTPMEQKERAASLPAEAIRPPRSNSLGSAEFFGERNAAPAKAPGIIPIPPEPAVPAAVKTLRIRNASPAPLTSLNSTRPAETPKRPSLPSVPAPTLPQKFVPQANRPSPIPLGGVPAVPPAPRQAKLRRFMAGAREHFAPPTRPNSIAPAAKSSEPVPLSALPPSRLASWSFIVLGAFSAFAIIGALLFIVLPKANVTVIPQGSTQDATYQFIGTRSALSENEASKAIPARVADVEKSVSLTVGATGTGSGEVGKARGTVILSNNYSTQPQPLVATTRLQAPDGKIFRLTQGVTIPGMVGGQPGIIEASVIASEAGEGYNIGPTTFTIPGFQGSPKFEKFSGKSTQAMLGGSSGNVPGPKSVSASDLDTARGRAADEARANFKNDVAPTLQPGEKLFEESIEVTPVGTPNAPAAGTVADNFDYQAKFRVRAFIVSEQSIRDFIDKQAVKTGSSDAVSLKPVAYTMNYGVPLSNYDSGRIDFSIQAKLELRAPVNTEGLRQELLGKNQAGIEAVLQKHAEIKSLQVEFKPQLFITSIPKNPKRVSVTVAENGAQ